MVLLKYGEKQWDSSIHSQGDYFEGDGSKLRQNFLLDLVWELSDTPHIY
jgi:hypothetical protein